LKENNALLEIGCEEIPARFMTGLIKDLGKKAEEKLAASRLAFSRIETLGTPRRLVLFAENLTAKQPDVVEDVQGPPAEAAFTPDNKPTPAAIGFAKKYGIKVEALNIRTVGPKNYVFARIKRKGLPAEKVLSSVFPEIIKSLYLPISMRWQDVDFQFIRPIHWILALYGNKIVKFELAGIKSGNFTYGHKFKSQKSKVKITIQNSKVDEFKAKLLKAGVLVDQDERKEKIRREVKKAAPGAQLDDELLNEVNFLVEYPVILKGKFDPAFLSLPKEVLITTMKKNQKYFPVLDEGGKLTSAFVLVTNNCKVKSVAQGNQRVLSARLSDAKFFFEEDKKVPLKLRIPDLAKVEFFEKLGTLAEKTERLKKLSEYLAKHLKLEEKYLPLVERIAELSKADLTTQMVFEFPELQGVMGREYALSSGEDPAVAQGIFEHYLPRSAEDKLPESPPGLVVALADKIDTLVGCFSVGAIPTGSVDPYGLRRAAHGIVKIILHKKLDLLLDEVMEHAYHLYHKDAKEFGKIYKQLQEFIGGRLRVVLLEEGIAYDVADAVLANFNDILEVVDLAQILSRNRAADWFAGVRATADRIHRIAKPTTREQVMEADLVESEEKELYELYLKVNWEVTEKLNTGDYGAALRELARFTGPVENFFQKVMVMHEEERLKINRLALLRSIEKTFLEVADFTKIVI